jgi:hypothetical protein
MTIPNIRKSDLPSFAANPLGARSNFASRTTYHLGYFNDGEGVLNKHVVDLWYDKPLYGKVNHEQDIIVIDSSTLKALNASRALYAMNFVADAFTDFQKLFDASYTTGRISRQSAFTSLAPRIAWIDPEQSYVAYMKNRYNFFVRDKVNSGFRYKKIFDLRSFLKYNFIERHYTTPREPFTRLGYLSSMNSSVNISGLAIEVAGLNNSNDVDKEFLTSDLNYKFFLFHARKHGFYVDKNCPWRLIANPRSTAMIPYMNKYDIEDYVSLFENNFFIAYKDDFDTFKMMATMFYESYRRANPTFDFGGTCHDARQPKSRVYTLTRKTLEDSGVKDEELFYYYLIVRYAEYGNNMHDCIRKSKHFMKKNKNKTIPQMLAVLNGQLNKHPDVFIPPTPGGGENGR